MVGGLGKELGMKMAGGGGPGRKSRQEIMMTWTEIVSMEMKKVKNKI